MAKRAASSTSTTQLSSLALNDHLSKSAQQQLTALRRALESRLAALEEVLKDPGRGESLAGLILDLSRVATEEAQLAAAVCTGSHPSLPQDTFRVLPAKREPSGR